MLVGYARTSTADQIAGLDAQERDLKAAGCEKVFSERVSSVASRAKLTDCLSFLRQGDVLTVTKPDRLARSTAELLSIEADLSKRSIGLMVLSMGGERLDTRNPTSKLISDKASDEQRVDDCKVPQARRTRPRPTTCHWS
jgi:DNA invertase Pin-like site-specific DNA recombinase